MTPEEIMIQYLLLKVEQKDWHGVSDAANDLRERCKQKRRKTVDILDTRSNLNAMVLCHEQQIKDLAEHLLELKQLLTPTMEFNKEKKEWVGLTDEEKQKAYLIVDTWSNCVNFIEKTLREKNK